MYKYQPLTEQQILEREEERARNARWEDGRYSFIVKNAIEKEGLTNKGQPYFGFYIIFGLFDNGREIEIHKTIFAEKIEFLDFFRSIGRMDLYQECVSDGTRLINQMGDCEAENITKRIQDKRTGLMVDRTFLEIIKFIPAEQRNKSRAANNASQYNEINPPPHNGFDDEITL